MNQISQDVHDPLLDVGENAELIRTASRMVEDAAYNLAGVLQASSICHLILLSHQLSVACDRMEQYREEQLV